MPPKDRQLSVVPGDGRRTAPAPGKQWTCSRCAQEHGVATSTLERYSVWLAPRLVKGKLVSGTKRQGWRCATCKTEVT